MQLRFLDPYAGGEVWGKQMGNAVDLIETDGSIRFSITTETLNNRAL